MGGPTILATLAVVAGIINAAPIPSMIDSPISSTGTEWLMEDVWPEMREHDPGVGGVVRYPRAIPA